MPLLRWNRTIALRYGGGAAGLFGLRAVRSDCRSDRATPCRCAREGGGPRGDPPTARQRSREAAHRPRDHQGTQGALTAALDLEGQFRDRMSPFPHRAAGPQGAMARPHQAAGDGGGYLLPRRDVEIDSPAAPLLLGDTPPKKWNAIRERRGEEP